MSKPSAVATEMKHAEAFYKTHVTGQTYTILRLDGKAFHTFTKGFKKPFDKAISLAMGDAAYTLMEEIPSVKMVYTQSDEISLVLTDFGKSTTEQWYGGNVQKMVSVSASMASVFFERSLQDNLSTQDAKNLFKTYACFDARVFTLDTKKDVLRYLWWRFDDARRNSVSAVAQSVFSHKQLQGVNTSGMIKMLDEAGVDFYNKYSASERNGVLFTKEKSEEEVSFTRKDTGETLTETVIRNKVVYRPCPDTGFTDLFNENVPEKD